MFVERLFYYSYAFTIIFVCKIFHHKKGDVFWILFVVAFELLNLYEHEEAELKMKIDELKEKQSKRDENKKKSEELKRKYNENLQALGTNSCQTIEDEALEASRDLANRRKMLDNWRKWT